MKLVILLISASLLVNAGEMNEKFLSKGCKLTNRKWNIVSKVDKHVYEIRILGGRYHKDEIGMLIIPSLEYKNKGPISEYIFVEKVKTTKIKDKNGFENEAFLYKESPKCKKIWFNNFASGDMLTISYPQLPEFESSIQAKAKKAEQTQKAQEKAQQKKAQAKKIKKAQKRKKAKQKLEALYE